MLPVALLFAVLLPRYDARQYGSEALLLELWLATMLVDRLADLILKVCGFVYVCYVCEEGVLYSPPLV